MGRKEAKRLLKELQKETAPEVEDLFEVRVEPGGDNEWTVKLYPKERWRLKRTMVSDDVWITVEKPIEEVGVDESRQVV